MSSAWDPQRYLRFAQQRREPYEELVGLVEPAPGMRIVDLGCGPGSLTVDLAERFDAQSVLGIDNSETMLAQAATRAHERVTFEHGDVATHPIGTDLDLVFSNAALQWLPEHRELWGRLAGALCPTGQLAVQMPANFEQPTHTIAAALAGEAPFAEALGGRRAGAAVDAPEDYASWLHGLGFVRQVVRQVVYLHVLPGPEDVLEWVGGSMLTWYRTQLDDELFALFEQTYAERLLARLPHRRPLPFTYRRILMWASRSPGPRD